MSSNSVGEQELLGRLHPTSLLFELTSHLRRDLVPAVFAVVMAVKGSYEIFFLACCVLALSIGASILRYWTLRYRIADRELIVSKGLFFKRIRKVPTRRIQNIDLIQNPLHRLFRVAEVRVETASGTEPEATLKVLSLQQVEFLRKQIFAEDHVHELAEENQTDETGEFVASTKPVSEERKVLATIPVRHLVQAGLASNRGMLLVGVGLGLIYQFGESFGIDIELLWNQLPAIPQTLESVAMTVGLIVGGLLLVRLLGIIWYVLRFYGYELRQHGKDLRISCGLLTRVSATVPRNRIQLISIHRPLLMRWLGLAAIQIETAGGGASEGRDASTSVSGRWFLPVVPEERTTELVNLLRPDLDWERLQDSWKSLAPRAGRRLQRLTIVAGCLLAVGGFFLSRPWGFIPMLCAIPFSGGVG